MELSWSRCSSPSGRPSSNARVSTDTLVEREDESVTVELPTVSTTVKVAVTVTE